ncbi:MAG: uridine kinase [Flavobacteriales bacterium]
MNASKPPYLVGIAGGSASGKTSFLRALLDAFDPEEISLVSQDNYYRPFEEQIKDENGWVNFDLPGSINQLEFMSDLEKLKQGKPIKRLEYTFNNPAVIPAMLTTQPAPIIITEGLFVFHYDDVRALSDYKVYLHADPTIRLERRINRDHVERGYPEDEVRYQWENHVRPADKLYLEPYQNMAHQTVNNDKTFDAGLETLVQHLKKRLK